MQTGFRRGFLLASPSGKSPSTAGRKHTTTTAAKQQSTATTALPGDNGTDGLPVGVNAPSSLEATSIITGTDIRKGGPDEDGPEGSVQTSSSRSKTPKKPAPVTTAKVSGRRGTAGGGWAKGFLMNPSPPVSPSSLPSSLHEEENNSTISNTAPPGKRTRQSNPVVSHDLLEIDCDDSSSTPHSAIVASSSATTAHFSSSSSSRLDLRIVQRGVLPAGRDDGMESTKKDGTEDDRKPLIVVLHEEDETDRDDDDTGNNDDESQINESQTTVVASVAPPQTPVISILSTAPIAPASETLGASSSTSWDELGDESPSMMWKEVATIRNGPFLLGSTEQQKTILPPTRPVLVADRQPPFLSPHGKSSIDGTLAGGIPHSFESTVDPIRDDPTDEAMEEPPPDSKTSTYNPSTSLSSYPPPPSSSSSFPRLNSFSPSIMEFQQELERLVWQRGKHKTGSGRGIKETDREDPSIPQTASRWTTSQARWAWRYCMVQNGIMMQHHSQASSSGLRTRTSKASVHAGVVDEIATSLLLSHPEALAWTLQQHKTDDDRKVALQALVWLKRQLSNQCSTTATEDGSSSTTPLKEVAGGPTDSRRKAPSQQPLLPPPLHPLVGSSTSCVILLVPMVDLALHPERTMLAQSAWEVAILSIAQWMEHDGYSFVTDQHPPPTTENSRSTNTERVWSCLPALLERQLAWQRSKGNVHSTKTKKRIEQLEKVLSSVTGWMGTSGPPRGESSDSDCSTIHDLARDLKQQVTSL
jgi:hypothetical protein